MAEFPLEMRPLVRVRNESEAQQVAATDADGIVLYAASGGTNIVNAVAASKAPMIMFIRHKSGPFYLWYEIAHWRFLRQNGDTFAVSNYDTQDIVVDDYTELLWRLRALYGLANARGTKVLAIGGLIAYSEPAQANGPIHAKEVWGYRIESITEAQFAERLAKARNDAKVMESATRRADELLATPNVTLQTDRKFVVNSCLALAVCEQLLAETGASNFGFAQCMGRPVIGMLDTPPCLVLSLANDAGYTAYCHTDLSHTFPGVLMRWIAGRPTFVCNSHFPHDGLFTVAHCAAPRKMNGRDYEPAVLMTHYESDYGAACRVEYPQGADGHGGYPEPSLYEMAGLPGDHRRIALVPCLPVTDGNRGGRRLAPAGRRDGGFPRADHLRRLPPRYRLRPEETRQARMAVL